MSASVEAEIAKLAADIVKKATGDDVHLADKVEALKVLTAYYTAVRKHGGMPDDPDTDGSSFVDFKADINGERRRM